MRPIDLRAILLYLTLMNQEFEATGRIWRRSALDEDALKAFEAIMPATHAVGGRLPQTASFADICHPVTQLVDLLLEAARPVRCVTFNKAQGTNWALPWHQDRVIAVAAKSAQPGYANWSQKSGTWHCEPPLPILQNMIFARIHLSDTNAENGCLELSLGSHKRGKILSEDIAAVVSEHPAELCTAKRGDILFVKALTLHRSKASQSGLPRNTIRVDYANNRLPNGLAWAFDTQT